MADHGDELTRRLRSFALDGAPFGLFTAGCLRGRVYTKTAEVLLRHCGDRVVGVADELARVDRLPLLPEWAWAPDVPVADEPLAILPEGTDLVVGIALPGSKPLLPEHRARILATADAGHRVFNGLHDLIDHPLVVNLREFHDQDRKLAEGTTLRSTRVLTVGTGANVGKMTTTVALRDALAESGCTADWLPTGQTGMLLRGFGRCIDAVPGDFGPGLVEDGVLTLETQADVIVVEGQGSILHPVYSPVTVAVSHGARPQFHVLCHQLRSAGEDPTPLLRAAAGRYDQLHAALGFRSTLLGVSIDTSAVDEREAKAAIDQARTLGVPCVDVVRHGAHELAHALMAMTGRQLGR